MNSFSPSSFTKISFVWGSFSCIKIQLYSSQINSSKPLSQVPTTWVWLHELFFGPSTFTETRSSIRSLTINSFLAAFYLHFFDLTSCPLAPSLWINHSFPLVYSLMDLQYFMVKTSQMTNPYVVLKRCILYFLQNTPFLYFPVLATESMILSYAFFLVFFGFSNIASFAWKSLYFKLLFWFPFFFVSWNMVSAGNFSN